MLLNNGHPSGLISGERGRHRRPSSGRLPRSIVCTGPSALDDSRARPSATERARAVPNAPERPTDDKCHRGTAPQPSGLSWKLWKTLKSASLCIPGRVINITVLKFTLWIWLVHYGIQLSITWVFRSFVCVRVWFPFLRLWGLKSLMTLLIKLFVT